MNKWLRVDNVYERVPQKLISETIELGLYHWKLSDPAIGGYQYSQKLL